MKYEARPELRINRHYIIDDNTSSYTRFGIQGFGSLFLLPLGSSGDIRNNARYISTLFSYKNRLFTIKLDNI
jgi:hypothetical protein